MDNSLTNQNHPTNLKLRYFWSEGMQRARDAEIARYTPEQRMLASCLCSGSPREIWQDPLQASEHCPIEKHAERARASKEDEREKKRSASQRAHNLERLSNLSPQELEKLARLVKN